MEQGLAAPSIEWGDLVPLLILLGGACAILLGGSLLRLWSRTVTTSLAVAASLAAAVHGAVQWERDSTVVGKLLVSDALYIDRFAALSIILICGSTAVVALLLHAHLAGSSDDGVELQALLMTGAIGGIVLASANDLIVLFLGLEILSLSLYLLAASNRRREQSQEAGLKYFVLGGFASAFLLYGIALVYGATGSTALDQILTGLRAQARIEGADTLLLVGIGLMLVGFAFKVSAAPFHVWTPDVYEGSPSPVTALMASAGKVAAFVALMRVLVTGFERRVDDWRPAVWALAILAVVVGSFMAVTQTNVKRMLAYSSVSHAGFVLIGVEAAGHTGSGGLASSGLYLVAYSVLVLGSFAVVMAVAGRGDSATSLTDFAGLGKRRPALALAFSALLLAQAGVPFTSGFVAKFGVIKAAVDAESYAIAITAMVAAVVAAYLYLRIMVSMWLEDPADDSPLEVPRIVGAVVGLAVAFTLLVGFLPGWLLNATESLAR